MSRNAIDYSETGTASPRIGGWADGTTITFDKTKAGGSTAVGKAASLVTGTQDTYKLAADGEIIVGRIEEVEFDGAMSVRHSGFMELPADAGAVPARGSKVVGALSGGNPGYVRAAAAPSGAYVQATATDSARGRGVVWNNAVAAAVVVKL